MLTEPEYARAREDKEQLGDQQALLANAYEAVEQARRYNPAGLVDALSAYLHLLLQNEQYEKVKGIAEEILLLEPGEQKAIEATLALGTSAAHTNHLDEAEQFFRKAADLSRKAGNGPALAHSLLLHAGLVLIVRGQFHLALTMVEEARSLLEGSGERHWSEPYLRGFIYLTFGDRRLCRQVLDDLVLQVEPGTRLAAAYYLLWARLALDEEDLEQAAEYLRLGLRVANRVNDIGLNTWFRLEHSRYYRAKGEAPVARSWAEDALHQAQYYGSQYFIGLALMERAQANWDANDPNSAENDLSEALQVLTPLRANCDLTRARYLLALWRRQANHPEAESAWLEAIRWITQGGYAFILEKEQDQAFPLVAAHMPSKNRTVRAQTEDLLRHLANVSPPALRIATLGQFAVWKGRRYISDSVWKRRKAGELFRYLLLQPNRSAGREVIIEALWPDNTSETPGDLLHQATSALRHALEPDLPDKFPSRYLKVEGEQIKLQLPPGSVVDFEHFERSLPAAIEAHNIERLQETLNLYSGELFPSDRYADWSEEKRQYLADLHLRGLLSLAQAYLERDQYYNVINLCRQILHADAWNEDAVMLGMQAYVGLQHIPNALQMYQNLERTLRDELNISPRKDLREYAESLRSR